MAKDGLYDDQTALHLITSGSEEAFAYVFNRYRAKIYATARKFLKSPELAEEIVQEVFMKLWLKRAEAGRIENLEAFLSTVARNLIFDAIKKLSNEAIAKKEAAIGLLLSENTVDHLLRENQFQQLLEQAVSQLPPQQQKIFHLAKVEGLSHEAIAEQLNISRLTVKTHMAKALQFIRQYLSPHIGKLAYIPLIWRIFIP